MLRILSKIQFGKLIVFGIIATLIAANLGVFDLPF